MTRQKNQTLERAHVSDSAYRTSGVDQAVAYEGLVDAALLGPGGHLVRRLTHVLPGVAHRDADAGVAQHVQIVVAVADREGVPALDAQMQDDPVDAGPLCVNLR